MRVGESILVVIFQRRLIGRGHRLVDALGYIENNTGQTILVQIDLLLVWDLADVAVGIVRLRITSVMALGCARRSSADLPDIEKVGGEFGGDGSSVQLSHIEGCHNLVLRSCVEKGESSITLFFEESIEFIVGDCTTQSSRQAKVDDSLQYCLQISPYYSSEKWMKSVRSMKKLKFIGSCSSAGVQAEPPPRAGRCLVLPESTAYTN